MCVQQGQAPFIQSIFILYVNIILHLDGKGFWMLNI